jgi:hypothetical protein
VWRRLHEVLLAKLHEADRIDWPRAVIDSLHVRRRWGGKQTGPSPVDRAGRRELRRRRTRPAIARPKSEHGSGLGRERWVVERTISWLHQCRRLRVRYERRADIHEAFLQIAGCLICLKLLNAEESFC